MPEQEDKDTDTETETETETETKTNKVTRKAALRTNRSGHVPPLPQDACGS